MTAKCFMTSRTLLILPPCYHFHRQISDSSGIELGGASLIGYDLLHVPWDICPVIVFMMVFLSTWEQTGKNHNICWIQMCQSVCRRQWCTFVLQGALSPCGQEHVSASTSLDLSITWLMTYDYLTLLKPVLSV